MCSAGAHELCRVDMSDEMRALRELLADSMRRPGVCLFLTGAGISAESGVPTFRGKDGYWRIGSRNYHAQELATRAAFDRMPLDVWGWYLERAGHAGTRAPTSRIE